MENLAERLKFARKRCKLNQDQLAELSGIGQGVISKIERGAIKKTIDRKSTTLFLPHRAIGLALQMDDPRIPPGFLDSAKSNES